MEKKTIKVNFWGHFPDYRSEVVDVDLSMVAKFSVNPMKSIAEGAVIQRQFHKWILRQIGSSGFQVLEEMPEKEEIVSPEN